MTKDFLSNRGHALEEEYFWNKERELIARLRDEGRLVKERGRLRAKLNADEALLKELQEVGVTPDNLALLHLAPLVEVAWAEGEVTRRERELILAMAERRGVAADDRAYQLLTEWPNVDPGAEFFDRADRGARALLDTMEPTAREAAKKDLVKSCTLVAEAAGGILGMVAISPEERQALKHITSRLTEKQQAVARQRLSETHAD